MFDADHACLFCVLSAVQLAGLASLLAARFRFNQQCAAQMFCHTFFFVCLAALGLATMYAARCGAGCWFSSGTTLSLMIVGATLDLRRTTAPATF